MAGETTDYDLLRRVGCGEHAALGELYDRFAASIYSLARQLTGSDRDAEEVVQDVFVAVWTGAERFDSTRSAPFTWMISIARNKIIDLLRKTERRLPSSDRVTEALSMREQSDPSGDPRQYASARESAKAVNAWLAELPEEQSRPILLAYFEGLSHREIAARVEAPLGTVKSRIRLGLSALRDKLKGGLEF